MRGKETHDNNVHAFHVHSDRGKGGFDRVDKSTLLDLIVRKRGTRLTLVSKSMAILHGMRSG